MHCIQRLVHRQLSMAFEALRSRAVYCRVKRQCSEMWRQKILAGTFSAFLSHTHKCQCAQRALRFWTGKTVFKAFQVRRS